MRERYWVESAPGYVRLRHELGIHGPLKPSAMYSDASRTELLAAAEEAGLIGPGSWTTNDDRVAAVFDDEGDFALPGDEEEYWNELGYYLSLNDEERGLYERTGTIEDARHAAAERASRGAGGVSPRSRSEMWR
jgi:hypothetical protein